MHEDADRDQPTDPGDRRAAWRDEARSLHEEARALRATAAPCGAAGPGPRRAAG